MVFEGLEDEDIQALDDDEYEAYLAWAAREAADDIYIGTATLNLLGMRGPLVPLLSLTAAGPLGAPTQDTTQREERPPGPRFPNRGGGGPLDALFLLPFFRPIQLRHESASAGA
jgi:hypothetical protein